MEAWIYFGCGSRGRAHNGDGVWAAGSQSRKLSGHISSPTQKTELGNWRWGEALNPHSVPPQVLVSTSRGAGFPPFLCHYCETENAVTNILTAKSYPLKVWIKGNTAPKV